MSALHVSIHKDIGEYTEKVVGKLSTRTLACVAGGIATSVAVALFVYFVLKIDVSYATLPIIAASMPFWLLGFWRPCGMKAEKFLPLWWAHMFNDSRILYSSSVSLVEGQLLEPIADRPSKRAIRIMRRKGAELYEPENHGYWLDGYRDAS